MIVFSVIYALFLCAYFVTRVGNNLKYRAINKYILATMYMVYAIVMFHVHNLPDLYYLLMAALFLAYLGDIFLVFDFKMGGNFFLSSNICFCAFYLASLASNNIGFIKYFWIFIIWFALIATFIVLANKFPKV